MCVGILSSATRARFFFLCETHSLLSPSLTPDCMHMQAFGRWYGASEDDAEESGEAPRKPELSRKAATAPLPPEDASAGMYALASRRLQGAGFRHYEVSNYARPGKHSSGRLSACPAAWGVSGPDRPPGSLQESPGRIPYCAPANGLYAYTNTYIHPSIHSCTQATSAATTASTGKGPRSWHLA